MTPSPSFPRIFQATPDLPTEKKNFSESKCNRNGSRFACGSPEACGLSGIFLCLDFKFRNPLDLDQFPNKRFS